WNQNSIGYPSPCLYRHGRGHPMPPASPMFCLKLRPQVVILCPWCGTMGRKQILLLLPVIALLLFGSVWAILRPEGSPLFPFTGDTPREATARHPSAPLQHELD